jgi:hypothetical protein
MLSTPRAFLKFETARANGFDCAIFDCASNMLVASIAGVLPAGISEAAQTRWFEFVRPEDIGAIAASLANQNDEVFSFRIFSPSRKGWQRVKAAKHYVEGYQFCILSIEPYQPSAVPFASTLEHSGGGGGGVGR